MKNDVNINTLATYIIETEIGLPAVGIRLFLGKN